MVGLLGELELLGDDRRRKTLGKHHIRVAEFGEDLVRGVFSSCHRGPVGPIFGRLGSRMRRARFWGQASFIEAKTRSLD